MRGSNDDGFIQTKYQNDQYDDPNIMEATSPHDNVERERQQIFKTWFNHTMMMDMMQLGGYVKGIIQKKKMVR